MYKIDEGFLSEQGCKNLINLHKTASENNDPAFSDFIEGEFEDDDKKK